jgi:hypothetical protein
MRAVADRTIDWNGDRIGTAHILSDHALNLKPCNRTLKNQWTHLSRMLARKRFLNYGCLHSVLNVTQNKRPRLKQAKADIAPGSLADKLSRAKIDVCSLWSNS